MFSEETVALLRARKALNNELGVALAGATAGDNLGGVYKWSDTLTQTDDGRTVLRFDTNPGGWMLFNAASPVNDDYQIVTGALSIQPGSSNTFIAANPTVATVTYSLVNTQGSRPNTIGVVKTIRKNQSNSNTILITPGSTSGFTITNFPNGILLSRFGDYVVLRYAAANTWEVMMLFQGPLTDSSTTTAPTSSLLNSTYNKHAYGFEVTYSNLTGGQVTYKKTGSTTWISYSTATVV